MEKTLEFHDINKSENINDESIEGGALFKIFVPVESRWGAYSRVALIQVNKVGLNRSLYA